MRLRLPVMSTTNLPNAGVIPIAYACALTAASFPACAQSVFHRAYGYEFGFAPAFEQVMRLPSGSFILYGEGGYPETGGLSKLDAQGHMQWNQRWEFPNFNSQGAAVNRVLLDGEGKLIVAVRGIYPGDGALVRMDTNGTVLWTRQFGSPVGDVILTADGNCAVLVEKNLAADDDPRDIHLYKFALDGTMLFGKRYHCGQQFINFDNISKTSYSLLESAEGDFLLAFSYGERFCLLNTDADGDIEWMKVYMDPALEPPMWVGRTWSLWPIADGTLLAGLRMSPGTDHALVTARIAGDGQVLSSTVIGTGELDNLRGCVQAADGSLYLCAELDQGEPYQEHGILHLDAAGSYLGGWRFNGASPRPVVGFGADTDGLFDLLRVRNFTESSSEREVERTADLLTTDCDTTWPLPLSQQVGDIGVIDSVPLVAYEVSAPSEDSIVITPRPVTERSVCGTTGLVGSSSEPSGWYPNPTSGLLYPAIGKGSMPMLVELMNSGGANVVRTMLITPGPLDLGTLPPGIYLLRSRSSDGSVSSMRLLKE